MKNRGVAKGVATAGKGYAEELVYTESEDGLLLEGAVIAPTTADIKPPAIVWVHGLTGRFYGPMIVRVGRLLAEEGYVFITGNNRGHDFGTVLWTRAGKARFVGGAWERFEESPRDVAAWVGLAAARRPSGVVLVGHSLGALKVVYYQAQRQDPRVLALVAASPPLQAGRVRPDLLALADKMIAEGRAQDLLPWGINPVAGTFSAQTYFNRSQVDMDVFGHDKPDPAVARIRCPLLAFYGTAERWVGRAEDLELIRRHATAAPRVDTAMIEGADHRYRNREREVATLIARWVDSLADD